LELDRGVGEPIDIYVNDRRIARSEVIVVDGSLGVTLTEVLASSDTEGQE
jgi:flagellar motor switch protein FliN/FliY